MTQDDADEIRGCPDPRGSVVPDSVVEFGLTSAVSLERFNYLNFNSIVQN